MNLIHKQHLALQAEQTIKMHFAATVLSVQQQQGVLTVWYKTPEPNHPELLKERTFHIVGTGHEIPPAAVKYLATVQMPDGFVWHVYEGETDFGLH